MRLLRQHGVARRRVRVRETERESERSWASAITVNFRVRASPVGADDPADGALLLRRAATCMRAGSGLGRILSLIHGSGLGLGLDDTLF